MKCPECGSDSPPGSAQCTHCGRLLGSIESEAAEARSEKVAASPIAGERAKTLLASASLTSHRERVDVELPFRQEVPESGNAGRIAGGQNRAQPSWQAELSERVDDYRRRRSRFKTAFERSSNLTLDFDFHEEAKSGSECAGSAPQESFGITQGAPQLPKSQESAQDSFAKAPDEAGAKGLRFAEEIVLERRTAPAAPLEIVLGSPSSGSDSKISNTDRLQFELAPLSRRFLAGVVDTIVLLSAAGIFTLVFWMVGGHASPNLINEFILGFIAALVFLTYFGIFTLLTSSTPGLSSMGLEVRNLEGKYPTRQEAFWRAFGYLVSTSAMMLGFVWALFDSDGLTWHDRMSGTFLSTTRD